MDQKEAIQKLTEAGLYVHPMDFGNILGGSHVDASTGIRLVENSFMITDLGDHYRLNLRGEIHEPLTLEESVTQVIEGVEPQPSIEAPKSEVRPGQTVLY